MRQRLLIFTALLAFASHTLVAKPCHWQRLKTAVGAVGLFAIGAAGFIKFGIPLVENLQYGESPPAFGKRDNLCCACEWMPFSGCETHNALTCSTAKEGVFKMAECVYRGGRCQSRFETACRTWLENDEQKGCRKSVTFTYTRDHAQVYDGIQNEGCEALRYSYQGHGIHHDDHSDLAEKVGAFISKAPPGILDIEIDENACSMFNDTDVTVAALRKFSGPNARLRSIKVSGNQTAVMDGSNGRTLGDTRVQFTVDKEGVHTQFSPCHAAGLRCVTHAQTAQCMAGAEEVEETCCCAGIKNNGTCRWRREGSC